MTTEGMIRGFFAFLFAAILAWSIWQRSDGELDFGFINTEEKRRERLFSPIIAPYMLPFFLTLLFIVVLWVKGLDYTLTNFIGLFFSTFLSICFYYLILLLLLPLLRRWISATVCALLWLLPNFLYLLNYAFMRPDAPKLVWRIEGRHAFIALTVWTLGFAAVMIWKIAGHLVFRRRLLRNAKNVESVVVVHQWEAAQRAVNLKRAKLRLMTSPDITTPISVGCFRSAIRVVLPEKDYTSDELALIFRHELIHILRMDGWTKFFLAFCTALCWFNPLMWLAMRRSAEDLELSCDELVLKEADEAEKHRYAELLLRTAADGRGFTSCLSSSAASLRYRLEQILKPRKRFSGAIIAGMLFLVMLLSGGHIALAYKTESVAGKVFNGCHLSECSITHISAGLDGGYSQKLCKDEASLLDYISGQELYKISESYTFSEDDNELFLLLDSPQGSFTLNIQDHKLSYISLHSDEIGLFASNRDQQNFYLAEAPDWDYIFSLLEQVPPVYEPSVPELQLHLSNPETGLFVGPVEAARQVISRIEDGKETVTLTPKPEPAGGVVIEGFNVTQVELGWPIMPEHYTVSVEPLVEEYESSNAGEAISDYTFALAPYDTRYTVEAFFITEKGEYLCRFYFEVDIP